MKRFFAILIVTVLAAGGGYWFSKQQRYKKEPVPEQVSIRGVVESTKSRELTQEFEDSEKTKEDLMEEEIEAELPDSLNLAAPFFSQAPHGNWDYPWQEACEEASVLLVANVYFEHDWTVDEFNEEILAIVDWQMKEFGDYEHTTMEQTAQILEGYLGLETIIHEDPTFEDVQEILARGHLIVMPFAGRALENPFFTAPGPVYHVLVVKGYKEGEKIITHDVGTRRGEDYVYSWEVIENALHDYAKPIERGAKRYIEVLPPNF